MGSRGGEMGRETGALSSLVYVPVQYWRCDLPLATCPQSIHLFKTGNSVVSRDQSTWGYLVTSDVRVDQLGHQSSL